MTARVPRPASMVCRVCGATFAPVANNHLICSVPCRLAANAETARQWRAKESAVRRMGRAAALRERERRAEAYLLHTGALGIVRDVCRRTGDAAVLVLRADLERRHSLPMPGELMIDHGTVLGHEALTVRVDNWTDAPDLKSRIVRVARLETGLSCSGEVIDFSRYEDKARLLSDICDTFCKPGWLALYGIG